MKDDLKFITVGIRYLRSFRITDISGAIIDSILHDSDSPFSKDYFPYVDENSVRDKTLFNDDNEYLRITTDDLIFRLAVGKDMLTKHQQIKEKIIKYIEKILLQYEINNIKRIGIIFTHQARDNSEKYTKLIESYTNNEIKDPESISLTFTKKNYDIKGIINKGVNNYQNQIYSFTKVDKSFSYQLDFQYYFDPVVEDIRDCSTDKILDESKRFLESEFYKWIK